MTDRWNWQPVQTAPRDQPIWLFLPSIGFTHAPDGTVSNVTHACVVGQWDAARSAWINRETGADVYPSLWCDHDVTGVMPDNPLLAA